MNSVSITQKSLPVGLNKPVAQWDAGPNLQPVAVEVVVLWNNTVQDVVQSKIDGDDPFHFTIGETPECDFLIPEEFLDGKTSLALVAAADGVLSVSSPATAGMEISTSDGTIIPNGVNDIFPDGNQETTVLKNLDLGSTADISIGSWRFVVRTLSHLEEFSAKPEVDWESGYFFGISAILHAAFFLIVALVPPAATGLNLDNLESHNRFTKVFLAAAEARTVPRPELANPDLKNDAKGGNERHAGLEGKAGKRTAKNTNKRFGIKGPKHNPRVVMGRDEIKKTVSTSGVLSFLQSYSGPVSPFGSIDPLGNDPENALGALTGDEIGDNFGYGGLGIFDTGRGGGGDGTEAIKVGNLRTGGPDGPGGSKGPGALVGDPDKFKKPAKPGPEIRSTGVLKIGSISKDVIKRMVRRKLNEVKHCYEKGLRSNPNLTGRVSVKFTILASGVVQSSSVASSTIGDEVVESCIARVIKRISFPPPPDKGVVVVSYPFLLSSPDGE